MSHMYAPALAAAAAMAGHTDDTRDAFIEYQGTRASSGAAYRWTIRARLFLCFLLVVSFMSLVTDKRPRETHDVETAQDIAGPAPGSPTQAPGTNPSRAQP